MRGKMMGDDDGSVIMIVNLYERTERKLQNEHINAKPPVCAQPLVSS